MPLIKVRNVGKSILFIDSLGLTLRPNTGNGDFCLVDEEKAKNDTQFMKCLLLGSVETCAMTKDFKKKKVKSEDKKIEEKVNKKTESSSDKNIERIEDAPTPGNSDPVVVVPGAKGSDIKTARTKFYKQADTPMPRYIDEKLIRDMKTEDIDLENSGPPDIILSDLTEEN